MILTEKYIIISESPQQNNSKYQLCKLSIVLVIIRPIHHKPLNLISGL